MRQILAIALITIRNAVRSKVVISLLLMLTAVIVLLPLSVRSDGTVSGFVQIMLSYTLGLSSVILALTTVWAGCASVSAEVADRSIQMVVTKPVSRLHIWIGKWLGINVLNAVLVGACGLVTFGMLHWHLSSESFESARASGSVDQLLSARQPYAPRLPAYEDDVDARLAHLQSTGQLMPGANIEDVRSMLRKRVTAERNTLHPGSKLSWNMGRIKMPGETVRVSLEFRFAPSSLSGAATKGRWHIGTEERPSLVTVEGVYPGRTMNSAAFTLDERWAGKECVMTFESLESEGVNLIFETDKLTLLVPVGGFALNHVKALLIIFGKLSFLASLGVAAGCLFSLPVASFFSLFLLIMIQAGDYIERIADAGLSTQSVAAGSDGTGIGTMLVASAFKVINVILSPLRHDSPLDALSTGRFIDLAWTMNGLVVQGLIYALVMGVIASWLLSRRELALPTS